LDFSRLEFHDHSFYHEFVARHLGPVDLVGHNDSALYVFDPCGDNLEKGIASPLHPLLPVIVAILSFNFFPDRLHFLLSFLRNVIVKKPSPVVLGQVLDISEALRELVAVRVD
jgi:hypothetical protein